MTPGGRSVLEARAAALSGSRGLEGRKQSLGTAREPLCARDLTWAPSRACFAVQTPCPRQPGLLLVALHCGFSAHGPPGAVGCWGLTSAVPPAGGGRGCRGVAGHRRRATGTVRLLAFFHACLTISTRSRVEMYYHIDEDINAGLEITSKCIFQFESNLGPLPSLACGGGLGAVFWAPLEVAGSVFTWGAVWPWEAAFPPGGGCGHPEPGGLSSQAASGPSDCSAVCVHECACLYEHTQV